MAEFEESCDRFSFDWLLHVTPRYPIKILYGVLVMFLRKICMISDAGARIFTMDCCTWLFSSDSPSDMDSESEEYVTEY